MEVDKMFDMSEVVARINADHDNRLIKAAHHEAAHVLRGHSFGVPVRYIQLHEDLLRKSHTRFDRRPTDLQATAIQVCLAGPLADSRFLGRKHGKSREFLMDALLDLNWEHENGTYTFFDLNDHIYSEAEIYMTSDDFSQIFASLITLHVERYRRIPKLDTLLRNYRKQEQLCREWVAENWTRICALAHYVIEQKRPTRRGTRSHYLSAKQFYTWLEDAESH